MGIIGKITGFFKIKKMADAAIEWLKGKKTIMGATALLFWVAIYAVPAIHPQWAFIVPIAQKIQAMLQNLGLPMTDPLLIGGSGLTVIGLIDKIRRKFFGGE